MPDSFGFFFFLFFSFVASSHSWLLLASGHSNSQVFSSTYCYLPRSHYILNFGFKERTLKLVLFKFCFNRDAHLCIYSHIYPTLFQKKLADTSLLGQCQFGTCFIIWFIHTPSQPFVLHTLITRFTQPVSRLLKKNQTRKIALTFDKVFQIWQR